jgi:O-antigen/teichoic acid export membrane protein
MSIALRADYVFLEKLSSIESLATYSLGMTLVSFVPAFVASAQSLIAPKIFNCETDSRAFKMVTIAATGSTVILAAGFAFIWVLFSLAMANELLPPTYGIIAQSLGLLWTGTLLHSITQYYKTALTRINKNFVSVICSLFHIIISLALFPPMIGRFDMQGAAVVFAIGGLFTLSWHVVYLTVIRRKSTPKFMAP